ncbi:M56 family metallopeptidase [Cryptosporangium aurantiacum]|uniref:Peptidase family M48 n=1 Tax=Cryptosporangium aurantiacum TaxID=134849 RepID=A0A1M7MHU0_9ACTN|nr:M56 family metallopeptidase [Cryptosporangium aurantiacum]SHM90434.1 Peptidase family M48 [Cryptosporangium aurantiacum]
MNCWLLAAVLPWGVGAVVGLAGPRLARRVHPASATWCLTLAALGVAAATAIGAAAAAVALVRPALWDAPLPAEFGLHTPGRVATVLLFALPLLAALAAVIPVGWSAVNDLLAAKASWRRARPVDGVLIVDDPDPEAYAVPGRRGLVVMHTGLLAVLAPVEQEVVLAHERSHLERRHYVHVLLVRVASWLNPLLRPLTASIAEQVERWADEDAAQVVGDRTVAARAIAKAALARSAVRSGRRPVARRAPEPVLRATAGDATARATALMSPPLPAGRPLLVVVAVLALALPIHSGWGAHAVEDLYQKACERISQTVNGGVAHDDAPER